jgi:hypothetical protein
MQSKSKPKGSSWKAYVIFSLILYLLSSKTVFADNVSTVDGSQTQAPSSSKVVVPTESKSGTTIIINNNFGKSTEVDRSSPPPPLPIPAPPAPVPSTTIETKSEPASTPGVYPRTSLFRSSLTLGVIANTGNDAWSTSAFFEEDSFSPLGNSLRASLTLSFGINLNSFLSVDAWGGLSGGTNRKEKGFLGAEVAITPFKIDAGIYHFLELGVLGGASTIRFNTSPLGPFHVGTRINVNFSQSFGLTSTLRVGGSYAMWDAGVITYF